MIPEVDTSRERAYSPLRESPTLVPELPSTRGLANLELIWERRGLLYRVALRALVISTLITFLIPRRFESSVSLMPPKDAMSDSSLMLAAVAGKAAPGLGAMAGNMLGAKSTGALFVELMRSRTVQDQVVDKLNLQKVYWMRYKQDARKQLNARTDVTEDRKSGVISLTVTDGDPQRARDIAQSYVEALDRLVSQVSTSSARRERMFIEQRLVSVKADLEDAKSSSALSPARYGAEHLRTDPCHGGIGGRAARTGHGGAIELQSLEQIYTPNNVRVRALRARTEETQTQLVATGRVRFVAGRRCDLCQFQRISTPRFGSCLCSEFSGPISIPMKSAGDGI